MKQQHNYTYLLSACVNWCRCMCIYLNVSMNCEYIQCSLPYIVHVIHDLYNLMKEPCCVIVTPCILHVTYTYMIKWLSCDTHVTHIHDHVIVVCRVYDHMTVMWHHIHDHVKVMQHLYTIMHVTHVVVTHYMVAIINKSLAELTAAVSVAT